MTYLLLGEDNLAKDAKVAELKKKNFSSPEALQFDYEIIHAHKLESDALKKALVALPVAAKERLLVVRDTNRLSPHDKEIILEFIKKPYSPCILVLDAEQPDKEDSFISKLKPLAKVIPCGTAKELNVFELTKAISRHQGTKALETLFKLLAKGDYPLQIMGGLVWFWEKSREQLTEAEFKKGLLALEEADKNIKRSRLKPEHALELLVVKLSSSEAG